MTKHSPPIARKAKVSARGNMNDPLSTARENFPNGYNLPRDNASLAKTTLTHNTSNAYSHRSQSLVSVASSRSFLKSPFNSIASSGTRSTVSSYSAASSFFSQRKRTVLLTVFWAAPLVLDDTEDGNRVIKPVGMLDFRNEESKLKEALSETKIKVELKFDFATTDRLSNFLIQRKGRVLHYSGHGHPEFLAIEDGWGKMHRLAVDDLKEWIKAGEESLLLVFVSACHSRAAGEAFIEAGVKHVVCCQRNDQFIRNDAAIEFEKAFYQALADGHTLKEAFDYGYHQVVTSPLLDRKIAKEEANTFILLPEDANHNVDIFDIDEEIDNADYTNQRAPISTLPVPPENFGGRQIEMYNVISSLQKNRIVRLTGQPEVGLKTITCAACRYIQDRFHIFNRIISDIVWLECESDGHIDFSALLPDTDERNLRQDLTYALQEKQLLLVIDARGTYSTSELQSVLKFIYDHTNDTRFIILEHFEGSGQLESLHLKGKEVHIDPLSFLETLSLFGKRCPQISNLKDLQRAVISDRESCDELSMRIGREFYERIGSGLPPRIINNAQTITGEKYDELVRLGETLKKILSWKKDLQVHTRAELEAENGKISNRLQDAVRVEDYQLADECSKMLDEINEIRKKLPDLEELQEKEKLLTNQKDYFARNREYLAADAVKKHLASVQSSIEEETLARKSCEMHRLVNSHAYLQSQYTQLEEEYHLVNEQVDEQVDEQVNKFSELRRIRRKMEETKEKLKSKPSKEFLMDEIDRLHKLYVKAKRNKGIMTEQDIERVENLHNMRKMRLDQLDVEMKAMKDRAYIGKVREKMLSSCSSLSDEMDQKKESTHAGTRNDPITCDVRQQDGTTQISSRFSSQPSCSQNSVYVAGRDAILQRTDWSCQTNGSKVFGGGSTVYVAERKQKCHTDSLSQHNYNGSDEIPAKISLGAFAGKDWENPSSKERKPKQLRLDQDTAVEATSVAHLGNKIDATVDSDTKQISQLTGNDADDCMRRNSSLSHSSELAQGPAHKSAPRMQLPSEKVKKLPNERSLAGDSLDGSQDGLNQENDKKCSSSKSFGDLIEGGGGDDDNGSDDSDDDDDDKRDNDFVVASCFARNDVKEFDVTKMSEIAPYCDNMTLPKPNKREDLSYAPAEDDPTPKGLYSEFRRQKEAEKFESVAQPKARLPGSAASLKCELKERLLLELKLLSDKPRSRLQTPCLKLELKKAAGVTVDFQATGPSLPGSYRVRGVDWDGNEDGDDESLKELPCETAMDAVNNADESHEESPCATTTDVDQNDYRQTDTQPQTAIPVAAILADDNELDQRVVRILREMNVTATAVECVPASLERSAFRKILRGLGKCFKGGRRRRRR